MRLRVVSKLSQRSISNLEILFKFVFGGKPPQTFEEGKYYEKNTIIFAVEGNTPRILQCVQSGIYTYDDLSDINKWKDITVIDFVASGAEDMFNHLQAIIGQLEDYKGGTFDTVIGVGNDLYDRLKSLIINFPDYNSKVDGGLFTDIDAPPADSEEFRQKLLVHDGTKFSHANLIIDGNESEDIFTDEDDDLEDLLDDHNNSEDSHSDMMVDGNVDDIEVESMMRRVPLHNYKDYSSLEEDKTIGVGSDIIIKHNSNPKSHSKITIDGNKD